MDVVREDRIRREVRRRWCRQQGLPDVWWDEMPDEACGLIDIVLDVVDEMEGDDHGTR